MAQQLRKHYLDWEQTNDILKSGQIGVAFGYGVGRDRTKIGDGVTAWINLPYSTVKQTPHLSTINDLKIYNGNEDRVYVEESGFYFKKVTDKKNLLADDVVLVVSTYNGDYWLKDLGKFATIEDFGAVADWKEIANVQTDTFTVTVPSLTTDQESNFILVNTFVTGGRVKQKSRLEFKNNNPSASFALFVQDYYVTADDEFYIKFKNTLKDDWSEASLTIDVIAYNPIVSVSSGVITCPEGYITTEDIGKKIQIEDAYFEKALNTTNGYTDFRTPDAERYSLSTISNVSTVGGVTTVTVTGEIPDVDNTNVRCEVYTNNFDNLQAALYYADFTGEIHISFGSGTYAIDPFDATLYQQTPTDAKGLKLQFTNEQVYFTGVPYESYIKLVCNDRDSVTSTYLTTKGKFDQRGTSFMFIITGGKGVFDSNFIGYDAPTRINKGIAGDSQIVRQAAAVSKGQFVIRNSRNRSHGVFASLANFTSNETDYRLNQTSTDWFELLFENFVYKSYFGGITCQVSEGMGVKWIVKGEYNIIDINSRYLFQSFSPSTGLTSYSTNEVSKLGKTVPRLVVTSGQGTTSGYVSLVGNWFGIHHFFDHEPYDFGSLHDFDTVVIYDTDGITPLGTIALDSVVIDGGEYKFKLKSNATFSTDGITNGTFRVINGTTHYIYGQGAFSVDMENYTQLGNGNTFRAEGSADRPMWAQFRKFKNCVIKQGGLRVDASGGVNASEIWQFEDCKLSMNQPPKNAIYTRTDISSAVNGGTFRDCNFTLSPSITAAGTFYNCSGLITLSGDGVNSVFYNSNNIYVFNASAATRFIGGSVQGSNGGGTFRNVALIPNGANPAATAYDSFTTSVSAIDASGCSMGDYRYFGAGSNAYFPLNLLPILHSSTGVSANAVTRSTISVSAGTSYRGYTFTSDNNNYSWLKLPYDGNEYDVDVAIGVFPSSICGGAYINSLQDTNIRHGKEITLNFVSGASGLFAIRYHDRNDGIILGRGYGTSIIDVSTLPTIRATYNRNFDSFLFDTPTVSEGATKPTIFGSRNEFVIDTTINSGGGWKYYCNPKKVVKTISLSGAVSGSIIDLTLIAGSEFDTGATLADGWLDPTLDKPYPMSIELPISGGGTKEFKFDLNAPASISEGVLYAEDNSYIKISPNRQTIDTTNDGITLDTAGNIVIDGTIYTLQDWKRYHPNGVESLSIAQRNSIASDCLVGYMIYNTTTLAFERWNGIIWI